MTSRNLQSVFEELLVMCREYDTAPDWAHGLKLGEEVGEVNECILKGNGFLQHKTLKEDVMHEVADVMNTCCALLTSHYPDLSPKELTEALTDAMMKKGTKYAKVLNVPYMELKTYD